MMGQELGPGLLSESESRCCSWVAPFSPPSSTASPPEISPCSVPSLVILTRKDPSLWDDSHSTMRSTCSALSSKYVSFSLPSSSRLQWECFEVVKCHAKNPGFGMGPQWEPCQLNLLALWPCSGYSASPLSVLCCDVEIARPTWLVYCECVSSIGQIVNAKYVALIIGDSSGGSVNRTVS